MTKRRTSPLFMKLCEIHQSNEVHAVRLPKSAGGSEEKGRRRGKKKREDSSTCAPESQSDDCCDASIVSTALLCLACQMNLLLHNFQNIGCLMVIWRHGRSWSGCRLRHPPWRLETGGSGPPPNTSRRAAKPFLTRPPSRAFLTFRTCRFSTSWSRTTAWTGSNQSVDESALLTLTRAVLPHFIRPVVSLGLAENATPTNWYVAVRRLSEGPEEKGSAAIVPNVEAWAVTVASDKEHQPCFWDASALASTVK